MRKLDPGCYSRGHFYRVPYAEIRTSLISKRYLRARLGNKPWLRRLSISRFGVNRWWKYSNGSRKTSILITPRGCYTPHSGDQGYYNHVAGIILRILESAGIIVKESPFRELMDASSNRGSC